MDNNIIEFPVIGDERGNLISLEQMKNIPFEMKRVYYMYDLQKDLARGFHAHKDLQQVLVCLKGSCNVLLDDGKEKKIYYLDRPNKGLLIDKVIWREMYDFTDDCILMVIASEHYNEGDYLRDYEDFISYIGRNSEKKYHRHEKSIVESKNIGDKTNIWAFTHVFPGAVIGENCNINDHTLIENDVVLGNNVTVKSGVHIWDGVEIGNNVFIGPSVVFTNDLNPRSKQYPTEFAKTKIEDYASIGANSTIVAGVTIGKYAMIGAGSVVTKNIGPYTLWYGNPAKMKGYVCECGNKLDENNICGHCSKDFTTTLFPSN